jgi:DNA-binding NarL/FixJ family response regulator
METQLKPYKVLIVDDMPVVREALRWLIEDEEELTVIGEAGDGMEAIQRVAELLPEVVILDVELPGGLDGYAVARQLKAMLAPPLVIFLTVHNDLPSRRQALESGGDGFAEKGKGWPALLAQIQAALASRPP